MTHHDGRTDDTRDDWETPASIFAPLHREFGFTCDVAATAATAKCADYFHWPERSAFQNEWHGRCWMNPEYGPALPNWMARAMLQVRRNNVGVCALVPSRTDTRWFHRVVFESRLCSEVRFIKGRIKFLVGGIEIGSPAFASCLIILEQKTAGPPRLVQWDPAVEGQSSLFT